MSRIGRTEFVVLVEGKSEPFIRCINLCQAPCLVLKRRRVKVKRDSSFGLSAAFQRRFLQLVSSPDWIPLGRKIQKHVHDSVADQEVAVDRQEEQRATAVKRKRTESRNTLLSSSGTDKYITLVIATGSSESRNVDDLSNVNETRIKVWVLNRADMLKCDVQCLSRVYLSRYPQMVSLLAVYYCG